MKIYEIEDAYETDDPCPRCGWIVDVVDWDEDSFTCYCSQCKKTWQEKKTLKKNKKDIDNHPVSVL